MEDQEEWSRALQAFDECLDPPLERRFVDFLAGPKRKMLRRRLSVEENTQQKLKGSLRDCLGRKCWCNTYVP